VRCLSDKGRALFAGHTMSSAEEGHAAEGPPRHFDMAAVKAFLAGGYERPEWQSLTRRCLGCGACAYTCPTCHCFDIVDERSSSGGSRVRNWDACQFAMFTAHASGHNPRGVQSQRQRQRIHHKFQIYPDKFGEVLCTGCGNCARNCPVGLGVLTVLKSITANECQPVSTNPT
jgi:ferredoxin